MWRKILRIVAILLLVLLVALGGLLAYVKLALPDVGPAPALTVDSAAATIARGAYLANHVTVCIDCHSQRDWTHFAGPIVPGTEGRGGERFDRSMGFPGIFYSRNITPYGLRDWTDGEIYRAITTGVSRDGEALFPVMPYHFYGIMDSTDVKSIISYLRSLQPIAYEPAPRTIDFPMNFILNTIPRQAQPETRPPASDTVAYGHYLVRIAGCQDCHTKKVKGKTVGAPFAGGWEFQMPDGGILRTANITPDLKTGIGSWSREAFIHRFRALIDSGYTAPLMQPGQMQTVMPWMMYAGMDTADLGAIYVYLRTVPPVDHAVTHYTPAASVQAGTR